MGDTPEIDELLARCTFPAPGTAVHLGLSGGPDSTALLVLASAHGLEITAVHIDHRLREGSAGDAAIAAGLADRYGAAFRCEEIPVGAGPNLEARARAARRSVFPEGTMTGHTADDQAETVLLNLLRGAGLTGAGAMRPGPEHPILGLRRAETHALCTAEGLTVAVDETNDELVQRRNRIRHEVLPLLDAVAERDVVPLLARHADHARDASDHLETLAAQLDPTDARELAGAEPVVARVALRRWLRSADPDGLPPDAASIERVLAVARGEHVAAEISGGARVARSEGVLRIEPVGPAEVR